MTSFVKKLKHKLFLSFYHADDEKFRRSFSTQFHPLYVSKSVELGDITTDNSAEYIKRLIRENYIADASVVVVLVGTKTKCRKHVDWEIAGGLEPMSGRSGLLAVLLPEFPLVDNRFKYEDMPKRLADNIQSGYAEVRTWAQINRNPQQLSSAVEIAFNKRLNERDVRNGSPQMQRNTCD